MRYPYKWYKCNTMTILLRLKRVETKSVEQKCFDDALGGKTTFNCFVDTSQIQNTKS